MSDSVCRIVAGVAEPAASDPTLRVAMEVARAAGAELHLVHAYQPSRVAPDEVASVAGVRHAWLEEAARAWSTSDVVVRCRVLPGAPGAALSAVAAEVRADLVIVGAARGTRLGLAVLGTTALRVLRDSTVPVLVARRRVSLPLRRVLLTTDLSDLSAAAHDTALDTIDLFFHAPERVRSLVVVGWPVAPPPLTRLALARVARTELEAFLRERGPVGPHAEPAVRSGSVAAEIVAEAREWDADLLVVGTHARRRGLRMVLGSVAEAVLRKAPCNVLAVPPAPVAAAADRAGWQESPELEQWLCAAP